MKEGSKGKGEGVDDRERRKRTHLRWKDGKGLRGIKTERVLSEGETTRAKGAREYLVKRKGAGGEWRVYRERPYMFCLKKNVSCIRDKEKTEREEGGQFYLK